MQALDYIRVSEFKFNIFLMRLEVIIGERKGSLKKVNVLMWVQVQPGH
jgi:hypothetical protein